MKPNRFAVGWLLLALVLAGCGTNAPAPPALVSITQGVTTCGDVLRAATTGRICEGTDVACYAHVAYAPSQPTDNVVQRGTVGQLNSPLPDFALGEIPNRVAGGETWTALAVYADSQDMTLLALGPVTLGGITPNLDALTLSGTSSDTSCTDAPSPGLLVRAGEADAVINVNGVRITVGRTSMIYNNPDALIVHTLDGLASVSAGGVTRVVRAGEQTTLPYNAENTPGAPSPVTTFNGEQQTPPVTVDEDSSGDDCPAPLDWSGQHTVQRGESLTHIAPRYDVTIAQLQAENCLLNPNRLAVGQVLRVPATTTPPTPTALPTDTLPTEQPATATPDSAPLLTIDGPTSLVAGGCTTLRWSAGGAVAVTLDGAPAEINGSRQICPRITTVYRLEVRYPDGTRTATTRSVTVRAN